MQKLQVSVMRLGHGEVSSLLSGPQTQAEEHLSPVSLPKSRQQALFPGPPHKPLTLKQAGAAPFSAIQPPPEGYSQILVLRTDLKDCVILLQVGGFHFVAFYECEERSDGGVS